MGVAFDDFFSEEFARLAALGAAMSGNVEVGKDAAEA